MLGKQMVTDSGRGEAVEMTALPLAVGLERETRVELATLCLGSRYSTTERFPLIRRRSAKLPLPQQEVASMEGEV